MPLITTQLIEEYQKKIDLCNEEILNPNRKFTIQSFQIQILIYESFITSLQSKQSEERQNIVDAYKDGDVLKHLYKDAEDYFNQTFKQEQK